MAGKNAGNENAWKTAIVKDRTEWLLGADNPFVRHRTLRWLLGLKPGDPRLEEARRSVEASEEVRGLLAKQKKAGYWGSSPDPFKGTKGWLCLLLWLGHEEREGESAGERAGERAAPEGPSARKAVEYQAAAHLAADGSFRYTMASSGDTVLLPCHGAELARAMLAFGLGRDPRLARLVGWLASLSGPKGALPCPSKAGVPPCLFATAGLLRLREDLLESGWLEGAGRKLKDAVDQAASAGAGLFLSDGFARAARNRPTERWYTYGQPLQWECDELELLRLVAPFAPPGDGRARPLLERVLAKQLPDGTWPCEKAVKGAKWMLPYTDPVEPESGSKWITLAAYRSLKAAAHLL